MFDIDFSRLIEQLLYQPDSPMIFSSGIFLFLFLAFTLIYNLLGKADTLRILFVTLFSYYFYYKSSGFYFGLLLHEPLDRSSPHPPYREGVVSLPMRKLMEKLTSKVTSPSL